MQSRLLNSSSTRIQCGCRKPHAAPHKHHSGGGAQPPGNGKLTGGNGSSDDEGKESTPAGSDRRWPLWYTVWIWATALTYLLWRHKWRRDRKLAAEQLAREQQQEEELKQEWYSFAQTYGIKEPPSNGT